MKTNRRGFLGTLTGLAAAVLSPMGLWFGKTREVSRPGRISKITVPVPAGTWVYWNTDEECYQYYRDDIERWISLKPSQVKFVNG